MASQLVASVISDILESRRDRDLEHLLEVLESFGLDVRFVPLETAEDALGDLARAESALADLEIPEDEEISEEKEMQMLKQKESALADLERAKDATIGIIGKQTNIVFAKCLLAADKLKVMPLALPDVKRVFWGCNVCVFDREPWAACEKLFQAGQKPRHRMILEDLINKYF